MCHRCNRWSILIEVRPRMARRTRIGEEDQQTTQNRRALIFAWSLAICPWYNFSTKEFHGIPRDAGSTTMTEYQGTSPFTVSTLEAARSARAQFRPDRSPRSESEKILAGGHRAGPLCFNACSESTCLPARCMIWRNAYLSHQSSRPEQIRPRGKSFQSHKRF